jgi:uracil phosphoribosyltransferase
LEPLDNILSIFPLETDTTTQLNLTTINEPTRIYAVDPTKSIILEDIDAQVYLIDTPSGREIACHPHIVGEELSELCLDTAMKLKTALEELRLVSNRSGVVHILRGSGGYMIDKVFPSLPVINIRTKYTEDGYRDHSDDSRRINITYSNYETGDFDTLLISDTYATGRSVEATLKHMLEKGLNVRRVVLYGFIAAPGITRVYNVLRGHDIELVIFAICDITQLCSNHYDMLLYGLDEHLYAQTRELRRLGSIVATRTLQYMLPYYVPGMDQPGDWSERHQSLYNGYGNEAGDIQGHLQKSLKLMESLDELNKSQPWYTEAMQNTTLSEIESIKEKLELFYAASF